MRRALLTASRGGVTLPAIGDAFMGGYYVGIIDTTVGNIIAADASQTGLRYALIVSPKTLDSNNPMQYKVATSAAPAAASTRWDGLTATAAMATTTYPAANYCYALTYPSDAASPWYLPAMDELELLYRNLKPTTEANVTGNRSGADFPGTAFDHGYNPSSDPAGAAYTTSAPAQTSIAAFQDGGAQELGGAGLPGRYWSATNATASNAWYQGARASGIAGLQSNAGKNNSTTYGVRPVRRLLL